MLKTEIFDILRGLVPEDMQGVGNIRRRYLYMTRKRISPYSSGA